MSDLQSLRSYVPSALRKRLRQYAAKKGVSESSVTNAALARYLDDANDAPVILRKLDRMERSLDRGHRDSDVLAEAFAVFVQIWLAHTPRLPDAQKPSAEQSALHRFREYAEHVSEKVADGASFVADLVREKITEREELAATSPAAPSTGAAR